MKKQLEAEQAVVTPSTPAKVRCAFGLVTGLVPPPKPAVLKLVNPYRDAS